MPKPPVDPYARGNVVPPMKTAQKTSYEVAHRARGAKPLWGHRPYDPEFGNLSGITRSTVPIWSSRCQRHGASGAVPPHLDLGRHPHPLELVDQVAHRLDVL